MSTTKVKVAVRVRPMNKRGESRCGWVTSLSSLKTVYVKFKNCELFNHGYVHT